MGLSSWFITFHVSRDSHSSHSNLKDSDWTPSSVLARSSKARSPVRSVLWPDDAGLRTEGCLRLLNDSRGATEDLQAAGQHLPPDSFPHPSRNRKLTTEN